MGQASVCPTLKISIKVNNMAKKNMTIVEVKKRKIKLEQDILALVNDFEKETGVFAGYINFQRDYDEDSMGPVKERKMEKKKPVKNVEVSMDLDFIY